jgi:hypothetical protein
LNCALTTSRVAGETPDFIVSLCGRSIGIEITQYRSGETVGGGPERRQVEAEWQKLLSTSEQVRKARPELYDVNVGLMFNGAVPPRGQHATFIEEVVTFIHSHRSHLTSTNTDYWPPDFSAPLMTQYLQTLCLRIDPHATWYTNLSAGFVALPETSNITQIVAQKSSKQFRPVDELWLVIQSGILISEMLLDIGGVRDYYWLGDLEFSQFERVFVLAFTGAYEWKRGNGWRKL